MSLSAVIVDDEQLARDELAFLLKDVGDVDVVAQGKNGVEGVNLIREHNPDLVFLDVQMPGLDGFGVIKRLLDKKITLPKIVFATAFDQYAVKAFEVNAVDYLLKPFDKKRVAQSVQRVRDKLESAGTSSDKLETLVRIHRRRRDYGCDRWTQRHRRTIQLPHSGRAPGESRSQSLLARPPLLPGEHQPHQGSGSLVQEFISTTHGRQEADRNSSQPRSNQTPSRTIWLVIVWPRATRPRNSARRQSLNSKSKLKQPRLPKQYDSGSLGSNPPNESALSFSAHSIVESLFPARIQSSARFLRA
jgi:CheY-like chemotaxis protein